MLQRIPSLIAISLLVAAGALAQFDLGALVGTVRDRSDLPMANATVEIRSLATQRSSPNDDFGGR
jgi:hypothetical protein